MDKNLRDAIDKSFGVFEYFLVRRIRCVTAARSGTIPNPRIGRTLSDDNLKTKVSHWEAMINPKAQKQLRLWWKPKVIVRAAVNTHMHAPTPKYHNNYVPRIPQLTEVYIARLWSDCLLVAFLRRSNNLWGGAHPSCRSNKGLFSFYKRLQALHTVIFKT